MSWLIKRPIDGISLNGDEYLLDDDGNKMIFDTVSQAKGFLTQNGYDEESIVAEGIEFEEVKV